MTTRPRSISPLLLSAFACLLLLTAATRLPAAITYTFTKVLDATTPVPGQSGQTFSGLDNTSNQNFVIDGNTVAFTLLEFLGGSSNPTYSIWSTTATGGTPTRLADQTTAVPNGGGALFTELEVRGTAGGAVIFRGESSYATGLYSVPAAGGTITTLVDTNTPVPNNTVNFTFEQDIQSVAVHGSQVLFTSDDGIYFVPVTGGALTPFTTSSAPLVDAAGTRSFANDLGGVGGTQQADFGAGTVAFLPVYQNDFDELFSGPATGLTVGTDGNVNNATFIAGPNTPVPDSSSAGFASQALDAFVDDSTGTPVFFGASSDGSAFGIYAYINGVITVLADNKTTISGQSQPFDRIYAGQNTTEVTGGRVYFTGGLPESASTELSGIFTAPVAGGEVDPVVTNGTPVTGVEGATFVGSMSAFGGVSGGRVLFYGDYSGPNGSFVSGLFLATPSGSTVPAANQLLLSAHTGGNIGPVTVAATIVPGDESLVSGATVSLVASGLGSINGGSVGVNAAGTSLSTVIDLTGQPLGTYDFVITNPDGTTLTQPGGFTVEAGTGPQVYGDILGRSYLRAGRLQEYTITVGNRGDVDASMVPVFISFPSYFTAQVATPLAPVSVLPQPGPTAFDYSQIPLIYPNGDQQVLGVIVPKVPAGTVQTVQVLFSAPDVSMYAHVPFTLALNLGQPLLDAEDLQPLPLSGSDAAKPSGEHTEDIGIPATCVLSLFNLALDCGGAFFPPTEIIKCGPKIIATTLASIASNVGSDNASISAIDVSYGQAEATFFIGLTACAVTITPGFGTVINAVQCGIDTYLLTENCIAPALNYYSSTVVSGDPNDLTGSIGDGSAAHYLTGTEPLRYAVYFENEATASVAAQSVTVTNALDANLDLSTFSLGPIGFNATLLNPPAGATSYSTVVDLRPATNLLVQVTAVLNAGSRTLTYNFQSLDPATNQPPTDPTAGFLPPATNPPAGDGFAIYYVKPKSGLATGTVINDQASIVFDVNAAIATPTWTNTIDNDAPVSQVQALPKKEKSAQIPLQITGRDVGSGVTLYNIFVSEDGGAFTPLIKNATGPTVTFTGTTDHAYAFFSQAMDGAGNLEPLKTAAEASTKIKGPDLVGVWKGSVAAATTPSGRIKLKGKFKVTNQSTVKATTAGSAVRFYLSADATLDAGDPVIGDDVDFGALAPGASVTLAVKAKLPAGAAATGMYVIAVINPGNTLPEADYTNNTVSYGPLP